MSSLRRILAVLAILSLFAPVGAQEGQTTGSGTKGRVMIVLDASGSMLGEVDGQQKIAIARKALSDLLTDWDPAVEVGLIAYGHRSKGDCADIEVVVPCGPVDSAAITAAANNLTPLGKTPLSDATILAAETLKFSEESASVILISDGKETCEKDPCAVASELEGRGVNFTAHVIGFDVSDAGDIAQLKCLAENTGGKFIEAADAGELQEALSSVSKEVSEEPAEEEANAGPFKLSAVLSEAGPAVDEKMRWTIYEANQDTGERGKRVQSYSDPVVTKLDIPAGKYELEAILGNAEVVQPLDTEAGEVTVNLDAGIVNLSASLDENSDVLGSDVTWNVFKASDSKRFTYSYDATARLILPAGDYKVDAKWGSTTVQKPVSIIAGETTSVQVLLDAGILALNAIYAPESDPVKDGLSWTVTSAKADITGKYDKVDGSYSSAPEFKLPAGDYRVLTKVGEATTEGTFTVPRNDRLTSTVVMNAGVLHLKSATKPKSMAVYSTKVDITGKRERMSHRYSAEETFTLPAGQYVVEREGEEDTIEKEAEVKAGERTEITFDE